MKPQKAHLSIVSKYEPSGLVHPTPEEARNGWSPESLTSYLKTSASTAYEFKRELVMRARDREHRCLGAVERFKALEDLSDLHAQKALAVLERELAESSAELSLAVEHLGAVDAMVA
jgi:hypothetical protein